MNTSVCVCVAVINNCIFKNHVCFTKSDYVMDIILNVNAPATLLYHEILFSLSVTIVYLT
jgi:hypothetical protein